jgi:hypothetical protein
MLVNCAQSGVALANAGLVFPLFVRLGVGSRLPLEIGNRVRSAAGERHDVVLPIAGTRAACSPSRMAGTLPLELACYFTGSVLIAEIETAGNATAPAMIKDNNFEPVRIMLRPQIVAAIAFSMRPVALARRYRSTVTVVGHRRFAMRQLRRPAVDWVMAGWFHFAADCLALLILAIAVAGLVGIVVAALRHR